MNDFQETLKELSTMVAKRREDFVVEQMMTFATRDEDGSLVWNEPTRLRMISLDEAREQGERRAMQRVHKLLDDSRIISYADDGSFCRAWNNKLWELKKQLGLSDKDDEVQL